MVGCQPSQTGNLRSNIVRSVCALTRSSCSSRLERDSCTEEVTELEET